MYVCLGTKVWVGMREGGRWVEVESVLTAVLVGQTQSNMSAPRATATTMSSGYPW